MTVTVTQVAAAPAGATMGGWKAETHHAYMPALVTTETGDGGHRGSSLLGKTLDGEIVKLEDRVIKDDRTPS